MKKVSITHHISLIAHRPPIDVVFLASFKDKKLYNSSGLAIRPRTAEAAATAGEARYTSLSG
jgi:hypothetical protein